MIIVSKPQKLSQLGSQVMARPQCYNDPSESPDSILPPIKLHTFQVFCELCQSQGSQESPQMSNVPLQVITLNSRVIQIDSSIGSMWMENFVIVETCPGL